MEAMNQGNLQRQETAARSRAGGLSVRAAQILAMLITLGVFGTIGVALDALFRSLGQ